MLNFLEVEPRSANRQFFECFSGGGRSPLPPRKGVERVNNVKPGSALVGVEGITEIREFQVFDPFFSYLFSLVEYIGGQ